VNDRKRQEDGREAARRYYQQFGDLFDRLQAGDAPKQDVPDEEFDAIAERLLETYRPVLKRLSE
jgi:predicted anti-sigma-YlaC factor YlaD